MNFKYIYDCQVKTNSITSKKYYLDFNHILKQFPFNNVCFDEENIPYYDYKGRSNLIGRNLKTQASATLTAFYALNYFNLFVEKNKREYKNHFLHLVTWLCDYGVKSEQMGYTWPYKFDWIENDLLFKDPWISSMPQGMTLSVIARAYFITRNKKYKQMARNGIKIFDIDITNGGIKLETAQGNFYEMHPCKNGCRILDGALFGLMGLYDVSRFCNNKLAKDLFEKGVEYLKTNIDQWDFYGFWTWYGRKIMPCSSYYHKFIVCWLKVLHEIDGNDIFKTYYNKWQFSNLNRLRKWIIWIYSKFGIIKYLLQYQYNKHKLLKMEN